MPHDINRIQPPKLREFYTKGIAYIQQNKTQFATKAGDPEFAAWADYFDRIVGARPSHFQRCAADPEKTFTAPAQWPEWFDARAANEAPRPPKPKLEVV